MANTATTPGARRRRTSASSCASPSAQATEQEPAQLPRRRNESKVVEIPPIGKDKKPIRGLDPK